MKRTRELTASDEDKRVKVILKMDYPHAYSDDVVKAFESLTDSFFEALQSHFYASKIKRK